MMRLTLKLNQTAQQSSGVKNGLCVNQPIQLLGPYYAGYSFREKSKVTVLQLIPTPKQRLMKGLHCTCINQSV